MNRADTTLGYVRIIKRDCPCIFISYKNEDRDAAIELGNFIMNKMDIDIYLDIFDLKLQEAISVDNDECIVKSITEGLDLCDILLCIISDNTKLSWWVPYEIGIADKSEKCVASIRTKTIDDFPSFLKTKRTLNNLSELIEFIQINGKYGSLFYSCQKRDRDNILHSDIGRLNNYFEVS